MPTWWCLEVNSACPCPRSCPATPAICCQHAARTPAPSCCSPHATPAPPLTAPAHPALPTPTAAPPLNPIDPPLGMWLCTCSAACSRSKEAAYSASCVQGLASLQL